MTETFDYFVVGGGSGGMASARRAAGFGASVGLAEYQRLGGTCVNMGCVPKKIMWMAANVRETLQDAKQYGFSVPEFGHDFTYLKNRRDASIARLNGIYAKNLEGSKICYFNAWAKIDKILATGDIQLDVGGKTITAKHVLLCPGGEPMSLGIEGEHHAINSDGFFKMEALPKKVAVLGAGYIAVELAGMLKGLGSDAHLFTRFDGPLRKFDSMLRTSLMQEMEHQKLHLHQNCIPKKIEKAEDGTLSITFASGEVHEGFDCVLAAGGRVPLTNGCWAEDIPVGLTKGYITVDEYQNTTVPKVYACGDVCGKVELTPMAIAAGRRLADRLFGKIPDAKADYDMVPTVIFSHPPIGTVGMSEAEAVQAHGATGIVVHRSTSVNLYYNVFDVDPGEKPKIQMKVVCRKSDGVIIGMHVIGMGSDEMLQGFGVALKMGATKADLDRCIAIHPTAAEEMVTLPPWGR